MQRTNRLLILLLFLFNTGCRREPEPIHFGSDICAECKMTIVDIRFGAELITRKGKIVKFDSGECLLQYIRKNNIDTKTTQAVLVIDHSRPGQLTNALDAFYLHSEKIPSPMGGSLSAFASKDSMLAWQGRFEGIAWDWENIVKNLK